MIHDGARSEATNTVLSARKLPVPFGHVEAGIRSFDRTMPEETNRVIADVISDWLFAPTETAAENLATEGIQKDVFVTDNTVVDACLAHREIVAEESDIHERLSFDAGEYAVATDPPPA